MAIRKRGCSWQVYYRNPATNKIISQSFKTQAEAEKENARITYLLQYDRGHFFTNNQQKADSSTTALQDTIANHDLGSVFVAYIKSKNFSDKDIKSQYSVLRPVLNFFGDEDVKDITPKQIKDLMTQLASNDRTRATTHGRLKILRTILYFAVENELRGPINFPRIPSPQYKVFVPPSPQELAQMYAAAMPHVQRVIVIGAYCGVRVGGCELFQLTWSDVDFGKAVLRVHGSKKNENSPYREVPIRKSLLPLFEAWYKEDKAAGIEYIINYHGEQVKSVKHAWTAMLKAAGIERHIRPYDLRHAFGTELVAQGVDIGTVAKLMGHSTPTMLLKHYQYVLDRQKIAAVESLVCQIGF